MPADPLDKQLVEAVLSRPRRGKAELEEAKLAGLRPSRASAAAVASATMTTMTTTTTWTSVRRRSPTIPTPSSEW